MNPDNYTDDAELIRLRLQLHHEKARADSLWEVVKFERTERKRLEDEVERLRKAGDAVAMDYAERIEIEAGDTAKNLMRKLPVLREWNAAKEGNQP